MKKTEKEKDPARGMRDMRCLCRYLLGVCQKMWRYKIRLFPSPMRSELRANKLCWPLSRISLALHARGCG